MRATARSRPPVAAVDAIARDARHAIRSFAANPAFAIAAIVVFALAIGANTAVFSLLEASLLRPLSFAAAERLVDINQLPRPVVENGDVHGGGGLASLPAYRAWKGGATLLDELAVYTSDGYVLTGRGDAERLTAYPVSSNLFSMLGVRPILGRGFLPEEDEPGAPRIVVLSHSFWSSRFAGDTSVVGTTVSLDGEPYEIVGVMPEGFRFPVFPPPSRDVGVTFWVPLGLSVDGLESAASSQGGCWVIGRLREGVTAQQAREQLDQILTRMGADRPRRQFVTNVTPLHTFVTDDISQALMLTMGAVALVLLIGCSNVANLLLARAVSRRREMTIRMAIGASTARLMLQVMVESTLLAAAGGGLGVLIAYQAIPVLSDLSSELLPAANKAAMNPMVLGLTITATVLCGLLAGCAPALAAARRARVGTLAAHGRSGRAGSAPERGLASRTCDAFVVAQIALTLVLLVGAALLGRSLTGLLSVEPGFASDELVVGQLRPPRWLYPDDETRIAYARRILETASATPGVVDVAASSAEPFDGTISSAVSIPDTPEREQLWTNVTATTSGYFEVTGIALLRGDLFDDTGGDVRVAVIDRAAANAFFPGEDPLGRTLATYRWRDNPLTVIGVVENTLQDSLRDAPEPHVYVSWFAWPESSVRIVARVAGDPGAVAAQLEDRLREIDPLVPIPRVTPASTLIIESLERERFYTLLLGVFAAAATLMAGTGIFGLMRYSVSRRTREIGIRLALGARTNDILGMILGRGLRLTLVGVVLGAAGAAAAVRLLASFLFELSPFDPLTFIGAAVLLMALGILAAAVPAVRGTRTDPLTSVRVE